MKEFEQRPNCNENELCKCLRNDHLSRGIASVKILWWQCESARPGWLEWNEEWEASRKWGGEIFHRKIKDLGFYLSAGKVIESDFKGWHVIMIFLKRFPLGAERGIVREWEGGMGRNPIIVEIGRTVKRPEQ